ncbi:MAG: PKD domain-containing protein [Bacteroidetes bacterium]|nr:PKD domain-containing protein [Bacteroidota bacterium]
MRYFPFSFTSANIMVAASFIIFHFRTSAQVNIAFIASPTSGCAPLEVVFTNISNAGSQYTWDFGDGTPIDSSFSPTHTFFNPGTYNIILSAFNSVGNLIGSEINPIYVSGESAPDSFNMSSNSLCPGEFLIVNYGAEAASYQWDFGDGSPPVFDQWAFYTYSDSGLYYITLIVETTCGIDTIIQAVTVSPNALPNSTFIISANPACTGDEIIFEPMNYFGNTYFWNFGDGTTSNFSYEYHTYNTDSTYIVSLTVTNMCGNSGTTYDTLVVSSSSVPPVPVFEASLHTACPNVPIDFYYWNPAASYLWNFGDGAIDSFPYTSHSYTNPGNYAVTLTVTNGCGNSNSFTDSVSISNNALPPIPYFTPSLTSACPGQEIYFNTWVTADSYSWDFGDGNTDNQPYYTSHSYTASGNYIVTLTVTNSCGNSSSFSRTITINLSVTPPVPYFTFSPVLPCPGDEIQFSSWVEADSWLWNFGDGNSSTDFWFTAHSYADTGTYTVTLTVTNICGNSNSYTKTITVSSATTPPVPYFTSSLQNVCPDESIEFYSYVSASTYLWNFGDGTTDSLSWVSHSYDTTGNFTVTLTITNSCGNSNSWSMNILISDTLTPPVPYFSFYPDSVCPGDSVEFYAWGIAGDILWDFGDGSTDSVSYLYHTFDTAGVYSVSLTVTNACGNSSSFSQAVVVSASVTPPIPWFGTSSNTGCPGEEIQFYYWGSTGSYLWDFGDGNTDTLPFTSHAYSDTGNFAVTFTLTNSCGNSSWSSDIIRITDTLVPLVPYFGFYPDSVCPGEPIEFYSYDYTENLLWNFGDGTYDTLSYLYHTFDSVGTYTVTLTVTNICGNSNSFSQTVNISGGITPPIPYFSYSSNIACPGELIEFYSWDNAASWFWDFGDGATDTLSYSSHTYSDTGNFSVTLTITNACGNSNSWSETILITDTTTPPAPWFWAYPNPACPGEVIQFDCWDNAVSYFWDFGDGDTDSGQSVTHIYSTAGNFSVTLTVTNACGNSSSFTDIFYTDTTLIPYFYVYSDYYTLCTDDTFLFYTDFNAAGYQWDFGDGDISDSVFGWYNYFAMTHSYSFPGSYTVTLTATNTCGNSATEFVYVDVVDSGLPVNGGFYWLPPDSLTYHPCDTIQFYGWGGPNYTWNFGDGNTGASSNPVHIYDSAGWYGVTVTIFNGCGNSEIYSDSIEITGSCLITKKSIVPGNGDRITVFPNPLTGKAEVRSDGRKINRLEIYNVLGKIIYSAGYEGGNTSMLIDLSRQPNGIYYLLVDAEGHLCRAKISVVH